jgi:hypothetical protein
MGSEVIVTKAKEAKSSKYRPGRNSVKRRKGFCCGICDRAVAVTGRSIGQSVGRRRRRRRHCHRGDIQDS